MRKAEWMNPGKPVRTIGQLKEAIEEIPDDWLIYVLVHPERLAAEDIWEYGRSVPPGRPFALLGPRQTQADAPMVALETCNNPVLPVSPEEWMKLVEIAVRDGLMAEEYARHIRSRHRRRLAEQRRRDDEENVRP